MTTPTPERAEPLAPLAWFRILFGALMAVESFGAIATGWVARAFVEPRLTFPMHGLEFLRILSGPAMYGYFAVMGIAALGVAAGYRYRVSGTLLALLWTGAYLAQKSHYNNHYYLAVLVCWWMVALPAHRQRSMDVTAGRVQRASTCSPYALRIFRWQLLLVFVYAAIAKLYPGWLNGDYLRTNLGTKGDRWPLGTLVVKPSFQAFTVWAAILFDAFVIPALMWRRTRIAALFGLVVFNLFNSIVFRIGIFPYMVLATTVLFFADRWPEDKARGAHAVLSPWLLKVMAIFAVCQLALPLRHHLIPGDVNWTEEGHRLSWRMMLRSKSGVLNLAVTDHQSGETWNVRLLDWLSQRQKQRIAVQPEFLHRFARDLRAHYESAGHGDVGVYVTHSAVSLNGTPAQALYATDVDISRAPWSHGLQHDPWVLHRK